VPNWFGKIFLGGDNNMTDRKRIMLFGLGDKEITLLVKCLPQCDFTYAEVWIDIIAIPADLVIADFSGLDDESIEVIYDFYKQIEPSPEQIFITNSKNKEVKIKSVRYVYNLFESEQNARTMVLGALHDTSRDVDFSRRLLLALDIMKMICSNPGISTKELAKAEELSERSIKRYIDVLRMAGADIEYKDRGWHCNMALWDY
jgi:hypothetical protein